ncbi:hypothetical protein NOJ05_04515 [Neorhizobium galegae]|uniref:hypothetical protein n=1 Tax=Neorhizobium galegae TaxID=399 RepID=UPI000622580B|nr:hypothetical protein [Neorhizobium galegae]CDZ29067.1 Hypothetical protein NGAL_HAMBI490_39290 [Neorhizobium galegae bv. officinalis]MCQ1769651.1 hypothetical protein [Neorhizobium galegae]MCQ1776452.1 hypothetical protein [Neorhizobium galegae]MCQ1798697.1 hypothetical protein [Neorhizobium galegae]MCQ1849598.1 hypothetical protein [Neorhizobium galegae]
MRRSISASTSVILRLDVDTRCPLAVPLTISTRNRKFAEYAWVSFGVPILATKRRKAEGYQVAQENDKISVVGFP